MVRPHPREGLFADPEKLSEAGQALGFARRFGKDFVPEPQENIDAAPTYFRGIVSELQAVENISWTRGIGKNGIGDVVYEFADGSKLEGNIMYTPDVQNPIGLGTELYIELRAFRDEEHADRHIAYELHQGGTHVIRSEIVDDLLEEFDEDPELPDDPIERGQIFRTGSKEAELLRSGLDPSANPTIEELRNKNPQFRAMSDNRRAMFANAELDRTMGFNDQPVGIGELSRMRTAILSQ